MSSNTTVTINMHFQTPHYTTYIDSPGHVHTRSDGFQPSGPVPGGGGEEILPQTRRQGERQTSHREERAQEPEHRVRLARTRTGRRVSYTTVVGEGIIYILNTSLHQTIY